MGAPTPGVAPAGSRRPLADARRRAPDSPVFSPLVSPAGLSTLMVCFNYAGRPELSLPAGPAQQAPVTGETAMQHHFTPTPAQTQYFAQTLYPAIRAIARLSWRRSDGDKEDWIANVVANGWEGYLACLANGNTSYTAGTLAGYAMKHTRVGRTVGNRPGRSVEGYHARRRGVRQVSFVQFDLQNPDRRHAGTIDEGRFQYDCEELSLNTAMAQFEGRAARPDDIVAFRMDVPAWLRSLSSPLSRTAEAIVQRGPWARLRDVARKLSISSARLSQLRAELLASWVNFTR